MFQFLKSKTAAADTETSKKSWLSRLSDGLQRSRKKFSGGLATLILGKKTIDADLLKSLETLLLSADVGIESTDLIITQLTDRVQRKQLSDASALAAALEAEMIALLAPYEKPIVIHEKPFVILMV